MPRPTKYVSRSDLGWAPSPAGYANPKKGLVIHYDSSNLGLADKPHSACVTYWKNTRSFHTGPSRGWADIGYSFFACPHGYVLEGRGLFKTQAAQPGGNTTYYSCTLAGGPSDPITPAQINAVRQLRQWLMEPASSISGAVKGHRDFISTSCPGDAAYALVKDGTFATAPTGSTEEDDVSKYVSIDKTTNSRTEVVESGQWQQVYLDKNNSGDADDHHADGDWPSIVTGPADYWGKVTLRLNGLPQGVEGQARLIEVDANKGSGGEHAVREREYPTEFNGSGGDTFVTIPACGYVNRGRKLRVEVTHFGGEDVRPTVVGAQVRLRVSER